MSSVTFSIKSCLQVGKAGGSPKLAAVWVQRPGPQAHLYVHVLGMDQDPRSPRIFGADGRSESTQRRKGRQKQGARFRMKTRVGACVQDDGDYTETSL